MVGDVGLEERLDGRAEQGRRGATRSEGMRPAEGDGGEWRTYRKVAVDSGTVVRGSKLDAVCRAKETKSEILDGDARQSRGRPGGGN